MAPSLHPALWTSIWVLAAPTILYAIFIGLCIVPFFQRHFLYAHKVSTIAWTNVNQPEKWGFAANQVTPLQLFTNDGEQLYGWHIMPLTLYHQNEDTIAKQTFDPTRNFTDTESFRLIKEDQDAKLVIMFHGNAGHVAQSHRPKCYHTLTDTSKYHVLAIDYRGYGHSTGIPSEAGLIEDGSTAVEWATNVAGIPTERIVLLGQSLGTAVVSGVAERYALRGASFAGVVLVAGFSDLATMLTEYRIKGIIPVLAPFRAVPVLLKLFRRTIVDKWHSADRLTSVVQQTKGKLRIELIHAKDDPDIPWTEDNKLFKAAVQGVAGVDDEGFESWKEGRTVRNGDDAFVTTWKSEKDVVVRQELFPHGGHNQILGFAPVSLAIMRAFGN